jgi:hypothetical protein
MTEQSQFIQNYAAKISQLPIYNYHLCKSNEQVPRQTQLVKGRLKPLSSKQNELQESPTTHRQLSVTQLKNDQIDHIKPKESLRQQLKTHLRSRFQIQPKNSPRHHRLIPPLI